MPKHSTIRALALSCLFLALPALAWPDMDGACAKQPVQWGCLGHVELRSDKATLVVTGFTNHEMLVEIAQQGSKDRLLITRKGEFVDRLVDGENGPRHPFAFWGYALAPLFMTLPVLYPDGPGSVPLAATTRTLKVETNTEATVTTWGGADGEVRFRITSDRMPSAEGSYRSQLQPPLPGDFSLRGWYRPTGPTPIGQPEPTQEPAPAERLEQLR